MGIPGESIGRVGSAGKIKSDLCPSAQNGIIAF
jgi:hypothetical protein